jgi:hypothetical protein
MPPARTKLLTIVSAVFLCQPFSSALVSSALADAVYWGCVFTPTTLTAGPLTCRQTVECRRQSLTCRQGDKTLFTVDAFADHLAVSDNGQYIVGLSNRGMVPLYWLRNSSGEQINLTPASGFRFCLRSVTNIRQWFDEKRPDVTFRFDGDKLTQVTARGCDGHEVVFHAGE